MTLGEFILHLKHKSISIKILGYESDNLLYIGDVGGYLHWIYRSRFDKAFIYQIKFSSNGIMLIYIEGE